MRVRLACAWPILIGVRTLRVAPHRLGARAGAAHPGSTGRGPRVDAALGGVLSVVAGLAAAVCPGVREIGGGARPSLLHLLPAAVSPLPACLSPVAGV